MMNPLTVGMLLSLAPVSELRGGIPYAIAKGVSPWTAFACCTAANIFAIVLVFLFLEFAHKGLLRIGLYRKTFDMFLARTRRKIERARNGYKYLGYSVLTLISAVPLPVVGGAWTAVLVAWILGLNRARCFIAIALGTIIAGLITLGATIGIIKLFF